MKGLKKSVNFALNICIVLVAIVLFLSMFFDVQTTFLKKTYSSFFGYSAFEIETGSMASSINIGDLVLVKNTKSVDLNDVITYDVGGKFVTHRVVQQFADTFTTRGDANNSNDEPINSDQIVGKVVMVLPKFGIIKSVVFHPEVLIPFIVVLFIICLIIDDREDGNKSYISLFKRRMKREAINVPDDITIPDDDSSKTVVLSKVEVKNNSELYSALKNNDTSDDDNDEPEIIRIL